MPAAEPVPLSPEELLTTTRAVSVPLTLNTSTQSLSTSPASFASISDTQTWGPPRDSVSILRLSV